MYGLSVTFEYGDDAHDAMSHMESFRRYLQALPGIVDVDIYRQPSGQFTVLSKWTSVEAAQSALSSPGVNDELAQRAAVVAAHPQAVELFSV